jgi:hypothetical protein
MRDSNANAHMIMRIWKPGLPVFVWRKVMQVFNRLRLNVRPLMAEKAARPITWEWYSMNQ